MKIRNLLLMSAALFCAASVPANALSAHTWVSANGNDANSGTAVSPYADFATAVANTAAGGTVSVLGPGDYGPVTITQSITIDGTGGGSINFAGDAEAIYISAGANANIVLRNLSINGGGTGSDAIFIASAGTTNVINVLIDGCLIAGFADIGVGLGSESPMYVAVTNTTIQGGELGVRTFQNGTTAPVTVNDHVSLDHVTIQGASVNGVFTRNGTLEISNSVITQSSATGAVAVQADTYATLSVESSMLTQNYTAVCSYTNSTIRLSNNDIFDNGTGLEACGGTVATNGNNRKGGNPGTGGTVGAPNATINVQ
ncbi:MAG: hypothetical protein ABSF28_01035 [Terracidiphilus sp.]|jgi:hypothetical protein